MSINATNVIGSPLATGIVILLFGNEVGTHAAVERAADVSGSAGAYVEIAEVENIEEAGTPFFDFLPLANTTYWYRAKAVSDSAEDSAYTTAVSARPAVIPNVEWSGKPWLYDSSIPLQLVMSVVSETSSSLTVSASVNLDPVGLGTPTVSVASFTGVSAPVVSGSTWVITKPTSGTGRVVFTNTLSGRQSDTDTVEVGVDNAVRLRTVAAVTATGPSSVTVSVRVTDAVPLTGSYINLSVTSTGVGAITPTGSLMLSSSEARSFTVTRPTNGFGTGRVNFYASVSVRNPDSDSVDVPEQSYDQTSALYATLTIGTVTSGSASVNIPYSFPEASTAQEVYVYAQESSGSAPTISSVEFSGYHVNGSPLSPDDGRTQLNVPLAMAGNWLLVTFIPYDSLSRRGLINTYRYQGLTGSITPPTAFASASNTAVTSTSVTNSVTMPGSNLPASIRTYRDGIIYGADVTRTAGAGVAQTLTYGDLTPSTTYSWRYSGVNANGAESTLTTALNTTTSTGGTLATPNIVFSGWQSVDGGTLYFTVTNGSEYPEGTTFEGRVYNNVPTLVGTMGPVAGTTLSATYPGPSTDTGTAEVRAVKTGYTTSAYSTAVNWDATGGEPI